MPLILNIETATDVCSIALSKGEKILSLQESPEGYQHASQITLLIEKCMKQAGQVLSDLDAVALSTGPGSYTALRVGTSTAKGICYALNKPLITVDTLQSLAFASSSELVLENLLLCPMIDARRMEVYTALFNSQVQFEHPVQALIVEADSFAYYFDQNIPILFSGNGAEKIKALIKDDLAYFSSKICTAENLFLLALNKFKKNEFESLSSYTPNYFKAPNITTPRKIL